MQLHPTNKLLHALRQRGDQWPEVEADLLDPESMTPVRGFPSRRRIVGEEYQGYVEPDRSGEPDSWVVLGVRERERADVRVVNPVVGVEQRVSIPRARGGGVGRRWPTTYDELTDRLRDQGYAVEQTKTHLGLYEDGNRIATIATSASDWRSIRNICLILRRLGVDVRRT
ncbi:hypothetical protein SEA_VIEENROSE_49 [Streptomyces phage VieEnRose]|nr:hypothetical protein SEA_VIEENROSE_49 [Streptomyces phage VieEnRose]